MTTADKMNKYKITSFDYFSVIAPETNPKNIDVPATDTITVILIIIILTSFGFVRSGPYKFLSIIEGIL
jgi:hypothetical protein